MLSIVDLCYQYPCLFAIHYSSDMLCLNNPLTSQLMENPKSNNPHPCVTHTHTLGVQYISLKANLKMTLNKTTVPRFAQQIKKNKKTSIWRRVGVISNTEHAYVNLNTVSTLIRPYFGCNPFAKEETHN